MKKMELSALDCNKVLKKGILRRTIWIKKVTDRSAGKLAVALFLLMTSAVFCPLKEILASSCGFIQITDSTSGNSIQASINADGTRIAFSSNSDLVTGGNSDGNFEIFLFNTSTSSLTQITNSIGGNNGGPSINADGTRVAFASNRDLTGHNSDLSFEIFLFDTGTGLTQITNASTGDPSPGSCGSCSPSINADGTRIAFVSNRDLTGGNSDGNYELFLFDTSTSSLIQITNSTGAPNSGSSDPSINADGTRIAFSSALDPLGTNGDGNGEIFLFDTGTGLTQITNSTGGENYASSINANGTRIAFNTTSNLGGGNIDGNLEIFLFDTSTSSFTQITNSIGGGNFDNFAPSINGDGTRIAFFTAQDPLGTNSDGNLEIFLFDTSTSSLTQITNSIGGGNFNPSINADGSRIAFRSDRNLSGSNSDGNSEIFLSSCVEINGEAKVWIGLKNSDDQGTQFDLRTETYINNALVSGGETRCITGVTRNPNLAKEVIVPFGPVSGGLPHSGDLFSFRVLTRIGTNPDGTKCSGPGGSHNNAVGLRQYFDSISQPSHVSWQIIPNPAAEYFLHLVGSNLFLNTSAPLTGSAKVKDSGPVNFASGNPWKEIGTWSMTLP